MNIPDFLRQRRVPFDVLPHRMTFTAQTLAQAVAVPGDNVAKTVILKADGNFVLVVLQATHDVDFQRARVALAARAVELATEEDVCELFSDCEPGVAPPFGSLYGIETLVDEPITADEYIVFDGNCHDEAISMHYRDYEEIEHPQVAAFSHHV